MDRSNFFGAFASVVSIVSFSVQVLAAGGDPCSPLRVESRPDSAWVSVLADGSLQYNETPEGNKIVDFSSAGYKSGKEAIPSLRLIDPVLDQLYPSTTGGDDTQRIQNAITHVSGRTPYSGNLRGAVVLNEGDYYVSGTLNIKASGVALRGKGIGKTRVHVTGLGRNVIEIGRTSAELDAMTREHGGINHRQSLDRTLRNVLFGDRLAAGEKTLRLSSVVGLVKDQSVSISRPVSQKWIHTMGMDELERTFKVVVDPAKGPILKNYAIRSSDTNIAEVSADAKFHTDEQGVYSLLGDVRTNYAVGAVIRQSQSWMSGGDTLVADRKIVEVVKDPHSDQGTVTLDAPITDSIRKGDADLDGGSLVLQWYSFFGRIEQSGVQDIEFIVDHPVSEPNHYKGEQPNMQLIHVQNAQDLWFLFVKAQDFHSGIYIESSVKRVSILRAAFTNTLPFDTSKGSSAFVAVEGTQILVARSSMSAPIDASKARDRSNYLGITTESNAQLVVGLDITTSGYNQFEPHQRWATGVLFDNVRGVSDMIFRDAGPRGGGHGWTAGNSVMWNSSADRVLVMQPPGNENWLVGTSGTLYADTRRHEANSGTIESLNAKVRINSLFLYQLCTNEGIQAVRNLGY